MSDGLSDAMIFEAAATNTAKMAVTVATQVRMVAVISRIEVLNDEDQ